MNDLEKILGKAITVKQLAEYLKINEKTVREHYLDFNGIKVGNRYRFFTQEVANALEKRQEMGSADSQEQSTTGKGLPDTERSQSMGSQDEKAVRRRMEREDKHGLLD